MFDLLRRFIQPVIQQDVEAKYQMLRFADFWYYLGWVLYYEQAFVQLRNQWEAQAYDPKNVYDILRNVIRRK